MSKMHTCCNLEYGCRHGEENPQCLAGSVSSEILVGLHGTGCWSFTPEESLDRLESWCSGEFLLNLNHEPLAAVIR